MLLVPWFSCACAFLVQSGTPGAPQGDLVKKNPILCLRCLTMVLLKKIHDLVVHCVSLVQSRCPGVQEGDIVYPPLSPFFVTKKIILDKPNAFQGSKMICEEVFFLWVPFGIKYFDAFWYFLLFKVHVLRPSGPNNRKMLNGYLMFSVKNIVQNVKLI